MTMFAGRRLLEYGRYADHNGTMEEKYLHYFYAHRESEKLNRGYLLGSVELRRERDLANDQLAQQRRKIAELERKVSREKLRPMRAWKLMCWTLGWFSG